MVWAPHHMNGDHLAEDEAPQTPFFLSYVSKKLPALHACFFSFSVNAPTLPLSFFLSASVNHLSPRPLRSAEPTNHGRSSVKPSPHHSLHPAPPSPSACYWQVSYSNSQIFPLYHGAVFSQTKNQSLYTHRCVCVCALLMPSVHWSQWFCCSWHPTCTSIIH